MIYDIVMEEYYKKGYAQGYADGKNDSAKRGHWIIHSSGTGANATNWAECSECHVCGSPQWKVCPVCETRMGGQSVTRDNFCDDCCYCVRLRSGDVRCCNYLIMTNQRRPCPPGEECTVKVPRKVYRRRKKNA